jgi:hypothetical protein
MDNKTINCKYDSFQLSLSGGCMKRLFAIFTLLIVLGPATAQMPPLPPPINLGVVNVPQDGPVWCWAAVARQIIAWKHQDLIGTPPQCALVAMANGAAPGFCCAGVNPACNTTGSISQIQGLIASFGGAYSSVAPPAYPMVLYNTLQSGRPIILQISSTPGMAHVVVLQGMEWYYGPGGPRAMLLINDPMNLYPAPVPFESIVSIWKSAIVVN